MIYFYYTYSTGNELLDGWYNFPGTIDVTPATKYQFEKRNPYELNTWYRSKPYYQDTLNIRIAITDIDYHEFFNAMMNTDTIIILWKHSGGIQWRRCKPNLPYPSKLRILNGRVEFRVETEAFVEYQATMRDATILNKRWNQTTIDTTIWMGAAN